jgi:DNA-binding transcriptional regulator YdaS (Cro superfamily)
MAYIFIVCRLAFFSSAANISCMNTLLNTIHGLGQAEFARSLGVTQGLVSQWVNQTTRITAERAVQIHQVHGVPLSDIRPDLWPPDQPDLNPTPAAHAA